MSCVASTPPIGTWLYPLCHLSGFPAWLWILRLVRSRSRFLLDVSLRIFVLVFVFSQCGYGYGYGSDVGTEIQRRKSRSET
ncbi:hypothetical protein K438DRAFT_1823569 [Mycena galopus ATCC 62051]|nr:hypothetical protein K438DRAFT_1823569 [Mycena galopus ATCC 62051]